MRRRQRGKRLRPMLWAASAVGALGVVLAALAVQDLVRARSQLVAARATLAAVSDDPSVLRTSQGRTTTLAQMNAAVAAIDVARRRVLGSPALSVAGFVPGLRSQRAGLVGLINDSGAATIAGRDLLAQVDVLADRTRLRDGVLPLDGLLELQARTRTAGEALGALEGTTNALWGPLGKARSQLDALVARTSRRLVQGADAMGAARTFLGSGAERRYLVALENNAEMRDQGAVLSYVVIRFADGRLSVERRGSILELGLTSATSTPVPPGTSDVFGSIRPTQLWQSVNATADFAFSGTAMGDMYRQATGRSVDGIIAIDVPGLSAILRVVGPIRIEGVAEEITAANLGRILLHDLYQGLGPNSDTSVKGERQGDVVTALVSRLTTGSHDAVALGKELGDAAAGGHLRLWSSTGTEEQVFLRTGLAGGPALRNADRTFHLAVENRTATKLDYYVKPSVRQDVELTKQGSLIVRTTVTVDNQAPVGDTKPSYQLGPDQFTKKPGDYLAWVLLWGPAGSRQLQGGVDESGLNLSQFVTGMSAGERREVVFRTVIPNAVRKGRVELRLVPQPRLEAVSLDIRFKADGWRTTGPGSWQGPWDRVLNFAWGAER